MNRLCQILRAALLAAAVTSACALAASAAALGVGTVNSGGLRLRAEASTEASILDTAAAGDVAVVKADMGDGWYQVNFHGTEGYMFAEYVDLSTTLDADLGQGEVSTDGATLNVRSGPGTEYDRLTSLNDGVVVDLLGMDNGWFKLQYDGVTGYASSDYVVPCSSGESGSSSLGGQITAYAKKFLGTPYVWGGNGPSSFDCSGFTKYVYSAFGYNLNRTASGQLQNGVSVSRENLQPGDLVFFYNGKVSTPVSHVGIYLGGGDFIHASTNSYTVVISSLYSSNYARKYVYARRII